MKKVKLYLNNAGTLSSNPDWVSGDLVYTFSCAFGDADEVLVTEIYASREAKQEFSSAEVVSAMPHPSVRYTGSLEDTTDYLLKNLRSGDIVIVLSAGDADQISTDLLKKL